MSIAMLLLTGSEPDIFGQQEYTTPGSYSFVVPSGVTEISAVAVGGGQGPSGAKRSGDGGDLAYVNALSVTPGETLTVVAGAAGTYNSNGGDSSIKRGATTLLLASGGGSATASVGDTVRTGGAGAPTEIGGDRVMGGAPAAGYSANGTDVVSTGAVSPTGGAPGQGGNFRNTDAGTPTLWNPEGGGGVGLKGEGASGAHGSNGSGTNSTIGSGLANPTPGTGGSDGSNAPTNSGDGGDFGGGAAWNNYDGDADATTVTAGKGGVRIIWGAGRAYPSTNTADK